MIDTECDVALVNIYTCISQSLDIEYIHCWRIYRVYIGIKYNLYISYVDVEVNTSKIYFKIVILEAFQNEDGIFMLNMT